MESFMCIYFITIKNEENKQNTITAFRKALEWPRMRLVGKRCCSPADPCSVEASGPCLSPKGQTLQVLWGSVMSWPCLMLPQTDRKSTRVVITRPTLLHTQVSTPIPQPRICGRLCTHRCKPRWTEMGFWRPVQGSGQRCLLCLMTRAGFPTLTSAGTQPDRPHALPAPPWTSSQSTGSPVVQPVLERLSPRAVKVKSELLHFQRNPALGFTTRMADQGLEIPRRTAQQEP